MIRLGYVAVIAGLLTTGFVGAIAATKIPSYITAAVADTHRPKADRDRDPDRKPAQVLAFAGIKPGDVVVELIPANGYMTRLLSAVVGTKGHVYSVNLPTMNDRIKGQIKPVIDEPAYANVTVSEQRLADLKAPEYADVVWTSQNYHDFKNQGMFAADTEAMDKAIFAALKPGGTYIVLDHTAAPGSGTRDTQTLHRIDPDVVKKEVLAAGFKLEAESKVLANPNDPFTTHSDDKVAKFLFKFRKPR